MHFLKTIALFLAPGLSIASPVVKRVTTPAVNDTTILNFVLTLVRIPLVLKVCLIDNWTLGVRSTRFLHGRISELLASGLYRCRLA